MVAGCKDPAKGSLVWTNGTSGHSQTWLTRAAAWASNGPVNAGTNKLTPITPGAGQLQQRGKFMKTSLLILGVLGGVAAFESVYADDYTPISPLRGEHWRRRWRNSGSKQPLTHSPKRKMISFHAILGGQSMGKPTTSNQSELNFAERWLMSPQMEFGFQASLVHFLKRIILRRQRSHF